MFTTGEQYEKQAIQRESGRKTTNNEREKSG